MSRRGFVLITVLWVVAALSALVGLSLAVARTGVETTRNRSALTRGEWAREACVEILLSKYAGNQSIRSLDTIDLGRGTWCRAELTDPAARLNLNQASPQALRSLIGNDTLTDALLDWRDPDSIERPLGAEASWYRDARTRLPRNGPLAAIEELRLVRGFDSASVSRLAGLLTVEGIGEINLTTAPRQVLETLPGLGPEAVSVVLARRGTGEPLRSSEHLISLLSPSARQVLLRDYQEFTRRAVYSASRFVATFEGGVRGMAPVSRATITLVPAAGRLAVIRRRSE
jgi:type II secretory pathway component PulK